MTNLQRMAADYGPVFKVWMGPTLYVVLSDARDVEIDQDSRLLLVLNAFSAAGPHQGLADCAQAYDVILKRKHPRNCIHIFAILGGRERVGGDGWLMYRQGLMPA
ncbi:hypothetical protein J6590_107803 [Homalodisca vitripennis]|nr:hypothetical protein J6590_107803 [Homalodisca vitripennis]